MTKILGLTGGIGSGKTTVAKMFNSLGVPVYNADVEAKKLMQNSDTIKSELLKLFGQMAYNTNGLNRSYIANVVFKDQKKLTALNAIVHPEVALHFSNWLSNQSYPYVIKEVAILFEIGIQNQFDFILTVTAPKSMRIDRVMCRDNKTLNEILSIVHNQWNDARKTEKSTFVIHNIELKKTKIEVENINKEILKNLT